MNYIERYDIINSNQFGFTAGRNTADAVLESSNYSYKSLNNKKYMIATFLDLSNALCQQLSMMKNDLLFV